MWRRSSYTRFCLIAFTATKFAFFAAPLKIIASEAVFYGPSPYLSFSNSPFKALVFDSFYLETFEAGLGNLPGVTLNEGWRINNPASWADSVDADDGNVDGVGTAGHALFSGGAQASLIVSFDAAALGGHLPTHVGIVATDVGFVFSGSVGVATVALTATDTNGMPLGLLVETNFGNGSLYGDSPGATAEDRFFGVSCPAGIASVRLYLTNSADWEVDHLQFGYLSEAVPRPTLQIEFASPETIILRWPTNAVGFLPQQTEEQSASGWTSVSETPELAGTNYQITQALVSSNRFFRLQRP
ncbi:MAG: hypothetical protein QM813_19920 [Verrucomicrobiota bacterium]